MGGYAFLDMVIDVTTYGLGKGHVKNLGHSHAEFPSEMPVTLMVVSSPFSNLRV